MAHSTAFVSPFTHQLSSSYHGSRPLCQSKKKPSPSARHHTRTTPTQILQHVHTFPEIMNQLVISCGVGLAGIVGNKATEQVRALTEGNRRADSMDKLASEIDSFRRRKELAEQPGNRDWSDVRVDKLSNVIVVEKPVPLLKARDELKAFDSLLSSTDSASASLSSPIIDSRNSRGTDAQLPHPSEFVLDDELDSEFDQSYSS